MTGGLTREPQFVYRKNQETGEPIIFCNRPIQFKAYVFFTSNDPHGFRLLPEKDTEQIRRIMKRMHTWFAKWHPVEGDSLSH